MARPLKGSLEQKGDSWVASVPIRKGDRKRLTCSFRTEATAQRWIDAQIERLNEGLDAVPAPKEGRIARSPSLTATPAVAADNRPIDPAEADGPDFETVADDFIDERYVLLRRGGAERADEIRRVVRLHLKPAFGGPIPLDAAAGRRRVVNWVVACAGRTGPGSPFAALERPVARSTMEERLRVLRMILDHAHRLDSRVANFALDIPAQDPLGLERPRPRLLTMGEAERVSHDLHAVHQLVLWTLRVLGPRISEPYGVLVEDFIDAGDEAVLLFRAQGGRPFQFWGDQPGEVECSFRVEDGKTEWSFRLVGVPYQLADLIRLVIAAFHTDPETGAVDLGARLIPVLQSEEGGQAGFRTALSRAGGSSGVIGDDERLIPHDIRKTLCADFAWNAELDDILKRRWVGHRAGSDVFALIYALDRRLIDDLRPAVRALEEQLENEVGTSLWRPTSRRPLYSRGLDQDRLCYADAVLEEAGWQVRSFGDDCVASSEAAAILGMSETATRRLFPDRIPAVKHDGAWVAKRDDVVAYRERFAGWHRIDDLAERTRREYHCVYRTIDRLGIEPHKDDFTRELLLTDKEADAVAAEFERLDRLSERAVAVAVAAKMLRASQSSVRAWAHDSDRLAYDEESDGSGRQYVTRESIAKELERRGRKPKDVVTSAELREYAELTDADIQALVVAGKLVRVRSGCFTVDSVRKWILGYRPELLASGILSAA